MKILYISLGQPDYQCDCLLHGLYHLLGNNLTHTDNYHLMYKEYTTPEILKNISGRGFTIWGNLPLYLNDNNDIINKIKLKYFDYIIYGSFRRCLDYLDLVKQYYSSDKIAFVDGEDDTNLIKPADGFVFKRELIYDINGVYPISFAIPEEKIWKDVNLKDKYKKIANYKPAHPGTGYVYAEEKDYYNDYKTSFFALTHKKGGWDCMRHYEILANFCIPYFPDIQNCPIQTMNNFPKDMILKSNSLFEQDFNPDINIKEYSTILNKIFEYTKNNLTTKKLAEYVLNTMKEKRI